MSRTKRRSDYELVRQYHDRLQQVQQELAEAEQDEARVAEKAAALRAKRQKLGEKIEMLSKVRSVIGVSDHAVLRYLQHYCGLDVDGIRRKMLPPENHPVREAMTKLQHGVVKYTPETGKTIRLKLRDGVVVTALPPE